MLFRFLMQFVLFAEFAPLGKLEPRFQFPLIFAGVIIGVLAGRALQFYHVVLGHI